MFTWGNRDDIYTVSIFCDLYIKNQPLSPTPVWPGNEASSGVGGSLGGYSSVLSLYYM